MYDIAKAYDPSQQRDERGRWARSAGAVALRGVHIAYHSQAVASAALAAFNTRNPMETVRHVQIAINHGEALLHHLRALRMPSDIRLRPSVSS
jgi:hypothetical protein